MREPSKKAVRIVLGVVLTLALLFVGETAGAEPASMGQHPEHIAWLETRIHEFEQNFLHPWQWRAWASLALVVAVGALGVVLGLLRDKDPKRHLAKRLATYLGGGVAVLTFVHQTAFPVDYRALDRIVAKTKVELQQVRELTSPQYYEFATPELRTKWYELVSARMAKLEALEYDTLAPEAHAHWRLVAHAWAQPARPAWIGRPPQDGQSVSFVGEGVSPELGVAEAASLRDSRDRARAHLVAAVPAASGLTAAQRDSLAAYLLKAAEPANAFVEYDAPTKRYRYYTLLRIPRSALRTNTQAFALWQRIQIPAAVAEALASTKP